MKIVVSSKVETIDYKARFLDYMSSTFFSIQFYFNTEPSCSISSTVKEKERFLGYARLILKSLKID